MEFSVFLSPKLMHLMMTVLAVLDYIIVELHVKLGIFYLKGIRGSGSQHLSQKLPISHNKKPVYASIQPSE